MRESLACMTPVVSVDVGDVVGVLAGLRGCSIHPRDPEKLAVGVLEALRTERHQALRRRAERTSRHAVAELVVAVYQSVVAVPGT